MKYVGKDTEYDGKRNNYSKEIIYFYYFMFIK